MLRAENSIACSFRPMCRFQSVLPMFSHLPPYPSIYSRACLSMGWLVGEVSSVHIIIPSPPHPPQSWAFLAHTPLSFSFFCFFHIYVVRHCRRLLCKSILYVLYIALTESYSWDRRLNGIYIVQSIYAQIPIPTSETFFCRYRGNNNVSYIYP